MIWFDFSYKFPEIMKEKGWALYGYENWFFSLKRREAVSKIRFMETRKRYLILPYTKSDSLTKVLSLVKEIAEPPCYYQPKTSIIYPIDSLKVVSSGIMQIFIDSRLFLLFNPNWKGALPLVTLPFFMLNEKEIKERFNCYEKRLS
ncbi:hypothetical protein HS1_002042 [Candidatus Desulfofervidus auxilii]|uniref:Uncharacterized protein n=1 Tax=Desulfofervidus auxilii TaxID=1621989 RepID=A0A7U4THG9_DESA2|nr:hypothetical protein [Candidatus Desulfofervidus auxilii]AMM41834.1 hypothetical protein HS1_002042 [Candidatus Desulfofervidus auxilii]CAD7768977.1 MAG: hypothetical protein KIIPBIDF_00024 [Candidatus Methanoperedenaceae archaeon GB50]CAD7779803.1 hypothetical protein BLFGPEAP_02375 [Candidatus Methanoperedenaceae archaeon GB50]